MNPKIQEMLAIMQQTANSYPVAHRPAIYLGYLNTAIMKYEQAHLDVHGADCFTHNVLMGLSEIVESLYGSKTAINQS